MFGHNVSRTGRLAIGEADVLYYPNWIAPEESAVLMATLLSDLVWEQPEIIIAGVQRRIPRLQAWCGDDNAIMIYSGRRFDPQPWHPMLSCLRYRLGNFLGQDFNSVLVNLYRDGNDSVSWHSDDEPELGPEPCIASLSLGVTRRFSFKKRTFRRLGITTETRPKNIDLNLHNGDLLVMKGSTQKKWHHSLPKTKKCVGKRVNLTFRTIIIPA